MFDLRDYSRRYMEQYKTRSFEAFLIKARRKQVLDSLQKYKHENILEVGCGLEPLFLYLEDYNTCTIVERSEEFVQHARNCASGRDNIVIVQGYLEDVYRQLLRKDTFDFIVLSSVLHEVANPAELLQAVHQLCSNSTVVHINVPNPFSFHRLLALEMGIINSIYEKSEAQIKFQRYGQFDKESLFRILEENGFQILSFGTYFVKPFSNEQMKRILDEGIIDIVVIDALQKMTRYLPDMGAEIFVEVKNK